jgi:cellulose synthase/poly-beta-1,6-N-acetylglucosamine synthase-like glycosyltransferase
MATSAAVSSLSPHELLILVVETARFSLRALLAVVAVGLLHTAVTYWITRRREPAPPSVEAWPRVTVQLPMRNEYYVARRAIDAAAALDYPRDKLDIQVLDDSDDNTRDVVDAAVSEHKRAGTSIDVIRRRDRIGFKAGHLALGLSRTESELVAIFDADFVPPPDFLRRTVPHLLADARVALVQGRWSFLNRDRSILTRAQAVVLESLMLVEQAGKSLRRWPFQFNGSAGVWRRAAIEDAGGWRGDSLVEDLDLSYRAILRGHRLVHLPDLAVPTELPESMVAFLAQQRRWALGNAQLLVAMWRSILTARCLSPWHRLSMLMHLGGRSVYALLAVMPVTVALGVLGLASPRMSYSFSTDGALFCAAVLALSCVYATAQRVRGASWLASFAAAPLAIVLHVGISLRSATAFMKGFVVRRAPFVRTPKSGDAPHALGEPTYELPRDMLALAESAWSAMCLADAWVLARTGAAPDLACAALCVMFAVAFGWVGLSSLAGTERGSLDSAATEPSDEARHGSARSSEPQSMGDRGPA